MVAAVADTHAVIWYLAPDPRLSADAKAFMDAAAATGEQIGVSTITIVEIVYLIEKGKIPASSLKDLETVIAAPDGAIAELPLNLEIAQAVAKISRSQVPDMPDRIIAGTALHYNVPLISRDARIQDSSIKTIW